MATIRATLSPYTKPDGTANIRIRITQKRKSVYIPTDLFIRPADFKNGWATGENVTDTYIRYNYGIVDRANRQVISKLFS